MEHANWRPERRISPGAACRSALIKQIANLVTKSTRLRDRCVAHCANLTQQPLAVARMSPPPGYLTGIRSLATPSVTISNVARASSLSLSGVHVTGRTGRLSIHDLDQYGPRVYATVVASNIAMSKPPSANKLEACCYVRCSSAHRFQSFVRPEMR